MISQPDEVEVTSLVPCTHRDKLRMTTDLRNGSCQRWTMELW